MPPKKKSKRSRDRQPRSADRSKKRRRRSIRAEPPVLTQRSRESPRRFRAFKRALQRRFREPAPPRFHKSRTERAADEIRARRKRRIAKDLKKLRTTRRKKARNYVPRVLEQLDGVVIDPAYRFVPQNLEQIAADNPWQQIDLEFVSSRPHQRFNHILYRFDVVGRQSQSRAALLTSMLEFSQTLYNAIMQKYQLYRMRHRLSPTDPVYLTLIGLNENGEEVHPTNTILTEEFGVDQLTAMVDDALTNESGDDVHSLIVEFHINKRHTIGSHTSHTLPEPEWIESSHSIVQIRNGALASKAKTKEKKQRLVKNAKNMCIPQAFVVGLARLGIEESRYMNATNAILRRYVYRKTEGGIFWDMSNFKKYAKASSDRRQHRDAVQLLIDCRVPEHLMPVHVERTTKKSADTQAKEFNAYGLIDWVCDVLKINCTIYSGYGLERDVTKIHSTDVESAVLRLYLYMPKTSIARGEEHVHVLTRPNVLWKGTSKFFCPGCEKPFSRKSSHRCDALCDCGEQHWHHGPDAEFWKFPITCEACNWRFVSEECYQKHLENKYCFPSKFSKCKECGVSRYRSESKGSLRAINSKSEDGIPLCRQHKCFHYYCKECKVWIPFGEKNPQGVHPYARVRSALAEGGEASRPGVAEHQGPAARRKIFAIMGNLWIKMALLFTIKV